MVSKQFEWHESYTTSRMARKLAKQIACDPSAKKASQTIYRSMQARHSHKQDPTNPTSDCFGTKVIHASVSWVWLARQTSKAKTNMQKN